MATDSTMRAALLVREGDADAAFELRLVPAPVPGPEDVRIRIDHAALNHLDLWIRTGRPSVALPRIGGADGAGTIESAGAQARTTLRAAGLSVGDRVLIDPSMPCGACRACMGGDTALCDELRILGEHCDGTLAELVVVPAASVHAAPSHLLPAEAAALTLTFATAWRMLFTRAQAVAGERVLVWGGSSGVGTAALQLCAARGLHTIATTRSLDKLDAMSALGATHVVVLPGEPDDLSRLRATVHEAFGPDGADIAFDHLGAAAWAPSMQLLRRGGRYVTCGATTGANPPAHVTRLFWKQLSMLGSTMASRGDVAGMLHDVRSHELRPVIDSQYRLDQLADAHRRLESGSAIGKIVIDM